MCVCIVGLWSTGFCVQAQTIYTSSHVSFSPDGKAWTTDAGNTDVEWYPEGGAGDIVTGIKGSLGVPEEGYHYYAYMRTGNVPVSRWSVYPR